MTPYIAMFIPAIVASLGGLLAVYWNPSHQIRSLIQHFAAGVVLAALAVEVLPEIGREHAPAWVLIISFTIGGIMMYIMKLWSMRLEEKTEHLGENAFNYGLIAATFIDVAVDGFIIGAGFAAGGNTGLILALGLSVELLFLGLSLVSNTIKGWRVVFMSVALAGVVLACSVLGNYLLSGASASFISAILAFGVAALLYLVTDELLVEAHTIEEKPSSTLWLFAGFLIFWSIQLLSGE
jgi:ZIP family zinc transporter